jgi:hypothetical protein
MAVIVLPAVVVVLLTEAVVTVALVLDTCCTQ